MCRTLRILTLTILITTLAGSTLAADITWDDGGTDSLWSTSMNWDPGRVPAADDDAYINIEPGAVIDASVTADALDVIIGNADGDIGRLTMTGGLLTVHKTGSGGPGLWIANRGIGYFDMSGGTVWADNVYLARNPSGQGYMTMSDGSVTVGATFTLGLHHNEYGEVNMSGGTVEVASMFRCSDYGAGRLNMTGGTMNVAGPFYVVRRGNSGGANTFGHVQLDGGTLAVDTFLMDEQNSGHPATMDITGGTLVIMGDETSIINTYISNGWITAYSGGGTLHVDLVDGNTVLTAEVGPTAWSPEPVDGATGLLLDGVTLSWSSGASAVQHDVYFGTNFDGVSSASDPDVLPGRGRQATNTFDAGPLALGQTYYWRIDEVSGDEPPTIVRGAVWSFSALESLLVEDFEAYNDDIENGGTIWQAWVDAIDDTSNGGSQVGYDVSPFAEQFLVHGGSQSMPLAYANTNGISHSQTVHTFDAVQDWTSAGAKALSLWFYGNFENVPDRMYLELEDRNGVRAAVVYANPDAVKLHAWQEWNIDLAQFTSAGVDLSQVRKIYIGFGDRSGASSGSSGRVYFDDIRLYPSRCVAEYAPAGDLDGDCDVDYDDLQLLLNNWLESFVWDPTGGYDGNGCLQLDGSGERIFVPAAPFPRETFTYSIWFNPAVMMDTESPRQDLIYWSGGGPSPGARPALVHNIDGSGRLRVSIILSTMSSTEEGLAFTDSRSFEAGIWYHVAFTYDGSSLRVYVNGMQENALSATGEHWQRYTPGVNFGASSGGGNAFNGKLDDIRIYGRALSAAEVTSLTQAGTPSPGPAAWYKLDETDSGTVVDATGNGYDGYVVFVEPYTNPYDDNRIDAKDYAVLADHWLETVSWP